MSFLDDLKKETSVGYTENGAIKYTKSLNNNVDFYAQAGAMRSRLDDVGGLFSLAYSEDKNTALRNLLYLRDVRGGLGERDAFRKAYFKLVDNDPEIAKELIKYVPVFGRWDDVVEIYWYAKQSKNTAVYRESLEVMRTQISSDIDNAISGKEVSLLAKWLPSPSVTNKNRKEIANHLAHDMNVKVSSFRKMLSILREYIGIVETKLTEKNYSDIDFEKLPSKALFKYRQAFARNMEEKYVDFITKVNSGEVKMNASNVLPYEIVKGYIEEGGWGRSKLKNLDNVLEATWKSLDDTIGDSGSNAIVVADTSASMTGNPWYVAESLAIYCAERLNGVFKNHFITFSSKPSLIEIPEGGTLLSKMQEYHKHSIVDNTNIEATFRLILDTAVTYDVKQKDLPEKIIIISDMEFDYMSKNNSETVFKSMKKEFYFHGYELPQIVFWNVDSRADNLQARSDERGVVMVSGLTPNIFKAVLNGDITDSVKMMNNTLYTERYDVVEEVLKMSDK